TGGARFAVPTLGEIEGKLLVSEVVATSCLRQLFAHADGAVMPAIKRRIRRSLETRCQAEKHIPPLLPYHRGRVFQLGS
ncbi:hypothetical protein ACC731_38255, partial [Rhizobium ruizarguesonis]